MGSGSWDASAWAGYSATHVYSKGTLDGVNGIYSSSHLNKLLDPKGVTFRESCDSTDNPNSTALIIALDVTGSMGCVLDVIAKDGLNTIATEIYNRKPVTDPHIMFMGVGDVVCDDAPLQVTQFEADIRIAEQLTKIYFERGGGGNNCESYTLPWYFASNHTKIDCFEKRGKKGYLFTIGDECPPTELTAEQIYEVTGERPEFKSISTQELLNQVSRQYEVFHLIIEEGSYCRGHKDKVIKEWTDLLGQRAIRISDHKKLPEVIVSTLQVMAGENVDTVVSSWDGTTSLVVKDAIKDLSTISYATGGIVKSSGLVKF